MRMRPLAIGLAALLASVTLLADDPPSLLWGSPDTIKHIDSSPSHDRSNQLLIHHRNRVRAASAPAAVSEDIGDVAVVVDNGAIFVPPVAAHRFDLTLPTNVVLTPSSNVGFSVAFAAPSFDSNVGVPLPLTDDSTTEVPLGFGFPFLGTSYTSVWVNSDGNLTLGAGDGESTARDAARLIGGPPRIAPLLNDLNVETAGAISARVDADRIVVTWGGVPQFGLNDVNTFQVTLHSSGSITFAYQRIDAQFGVIGVAEGFDQGPLNEVDLSADLPQIFAAGSIFEEFFPAHGTLVDAVEVSKEFYRTHDDNFDFLVAFTDFVPDLGDAFAYNLTLKNNTLGIGRDVFDFTSEFGSAGELESFVMMDDVGLYWPDATKLVDPPIDKFRLPSAGALVPPGRNQISIRARRMGTDQGFGTYSLGLNSPMSVLGQEVGHRWGAFVPFVHPTKGISFDSLDLLGRGFAHWSFFFNVTVPRAQFGGDARASSLEGNSIIDLGRNFFCVNPGETTFLTAPDELVDGYTQLDQYLMGLRQESEVGPFWYVDDPTEGFSGRSIESFRGAFAFDDFGFCGKRVNLTVQNIQNFPGIGPRVPAIGDEVDHDPAGNPQPDHKTMAFILLVTQGPPKSPAHAADIAHVDAFRATWQTYVNGPATGGRGRFDTVLNPAIH